MRQLELFDTLMTSAAGVKRQKVAVGFCVLMLLSTLGLLPIAAHPMPIIPGFVGVYQSALVTVYMITTLLLFAQFAQTRLASALVLAGGCFYTTGIVFIQLLAFPNVMTAGLLIGQGADTLTWLWICWHVAPPLSALAYALLDRSGRAIARPRHTGTWVGWLSVAAAIAGLLVTAVVVCRFVQYLPKTVNGDDYRLMSTSGIGPMVELLTVVALIAVCWFTRLRTLLQLLVALSLFLLVLDNVLTDAASARGTIGWMAGRIEGLLAAGAILAMYLTELDALLSRTRIIAAARERERLISESARDHLDTVLEAAGMGGWELDCRSGKTRRTPRYNEIFGETSSTGNWGTEEFLNRVIPEDRAMATASYAQSWKSGRLHLECRIKRTSDARERWISVYGKTKLDGDGRPVSMAGCVIDLTEHKINADRLSDVARMASIGHLTGGIAHDFNNLLSIITGSLETIQYSREEPEVVSECLDSALTAAWRGSDTIGSLLAFSRQQVMRREVVNVNRLLQKFSPLLRQAAGSKLVLTFELESAIQPARLDGQQLEAALLNLVANARDAMPDGGCVKVQTSNFSCSPDDAESLNVAPGSYVRITVADTGHGMDQATVRSAFEPFFTTKEVGKGSGLGLSQVFGFASQEGGTARISSYLGVGTTVELLLPCSSFTEMAQVPIAPRRDAEFPIQTTAGRKVVLVVDDDAGVRTVAVGFLRLLGYETLTAGSAEAALERLRGNEQIDLMFSDVVMPGGMNGVQLTLAARAIREDLKVILASGYTASAVEHYHELPAGTPLLSKPYARQTLASTVESVLLQPAMP